MSEELADMAGASRWLGITPGELSKLVEEGKLKSVEADGIPKFKAADLEAYRAGELAEEELRTIPLAEEPGEPAVPEEPTVEVPTEAVPKVTPSKEPRPEVSAEAGESLFAGEELAEGEEAGEEVAPGEVAAEEEAGELVTPTLDTFAVARKGRPAMMVLLIVSLVLLVFAGIVVMNFIKFSTTGGAPQGILEWLTSRIGNLAG